MLEMSNCCLIYLACNIFSYLLSNLWFKVLMVYGRSDYKESNDIILDKHKVEGMWKEAAVA
jgi:hypothetical protein